MIKLSLLKLETEPWLSDLDYNMIISDLIANEAVLKLDTIIHHHVSTRLQHSLRVSYVAYVNAKFMGLDYKACARAGLLHDLFYFRPKDVNFKRGSKYIHPRIALYNARKLTDINDTEADIIVHHMWLTGTSTAFDRPHTKEGRLVSMIDKQVAQFEFKMLMKSKWNCRDKWKDLPNFELFQFH